MSYLKSAPSNLLKRKVPYKIKILNSETKNTLCEVSISELQFYKLL